MAGIPQYLQDKMESGEVKNTGGGGGVLDEGHYILKVVGYEEDTKTAGDGVNLEFEITSVRRRGYVSKYNWMSYSEKAAWKLRQLFEAAGYTFDSEYDELIDDEAEVVAYITQEPQLKDPTKMQNNIQEFFKLDDDSRQLVD